MKKKVFVLWGAFIVCVALTVYFWFGMNNQNVEYEEVQAKVVNSYTRQVKNKNNGSTYNTYVVSVEYEGETYDLKNPHSTYEYPKGKTVKAYLSNGKLYANVEGIKSTSPIAIVYFVFLFGSFGMLTWAAMTTSKLVRDDF